MLVATQAVDRMFKGERFSICTVREVCEVIGAKPSGPAFAMLQAMHCVNFCDMHPQIRENIPALMREVFTQAGMTPEDVVAAFAGVRA